MEPRNNSGLKPDKDQDSTRLKKTVNENTSQIQVLSILGTDHKKSQAENSYLGNAGGNRVCLGKQCVVV